MCSRPRGSTRGRERVVDSCVCVCVCESVSIYRENQVLRPSVLNASRYPQNELNNKRGVPSSSIPMEPAQGVWGRPVGSRLFSYSLVKLSELTLRSNPVSC